MRQVAVAPSCPPAQPPHCRTISSPSESVDVALKDTVHGVAHPEPDTVTDGVSGAALVASTITSWITAGFQLSVALTDTLAVPAVDSVHVTVAPSCPCAQPPHVIEIGWPSGSLAAALTVVVQGAWQAPEVVNVTVGGRLGTT